MCLFLFSCPLTHDCVSLVFEINFYNHCNVTSVTYKGWVSGGVVGVEGWWGWWGWVGKLKAGPACLDVLITCQKEPDNTEDQSIYSGST